MDEQWLCFGGWSIYPAWFCVWVLSSISYALPFHAPQLQIITPHVKFHYDYYGLFIEFAILKSDSMNLKSFICFLLWPLWCILDSHWKFRTSWSQRSERFPQLVSDCPRSKFKNKNNNNNNKTELLVRLNYTLFYWCFLRTRIILFDLNFLSASSSNIVALLCWKLVF